MLDEPRSEEQPHVVRCSRCGFENADPTTNCTRCYSFLPGNVAALKHGGRRSLESPEALAAIAGKREQLIEHLGGEPSVIQADLCTDYSRVDTLIETMAQNIELHGVLTPTKGSIRSAVNLLLQLLDRRQRLAILLGIERRVKPVASVTEIMRAAAHKEHEP